MNDEPEKATVSRRDFLRRAGKEAVATGTQIIPGAKLAQQVLDAGEEGGKTPKWVRTIAQWRERIRPSAPDVPDSDNTIPMEKPDA